MRPTYHLRNPSLDGGPPKLPRSRVTSGKRSLLGSADHRVEWVKRFDDLVDNMVAHLGGDDMVTEPQRHILRGACVIEVEKELIEAKLATKGDGGGLKTLLLYQRLCNTQRRSLEALGIDRIPRDVTPTTLGQILQSGREAA